MRKIPKVLSVFSLEIIGKFGFTKSSVFWLIPQEPQPERGSKRALVWLLDISMASSSINLFWAKNFSSAVIIGSIMNMKNE